MTDDRSEQNTSQRLLHLNNIGDNRFRSQYNQNNQIGGLFGGQLLAQALAAAFKTVPDWAVHNCNAYFLSAGKLDTPVEYQVDCIRDGRSYAVRRVTASQGDRLILDLQCSFKNQQSNHQSTDQFTHQTEKAPAIPAPETLLTERAFLQANTDRIPKMVVDAYCKPFPAEICPVEADAIFLQGSNSPLRHYWFRLPSAASVNGESEHACLLAFLSDFRLAGLSVAPHLTAIEIDRISRVATLNHSLWFHHPLNVSDWFIFRMESSWLGDERGMTNGTIYNREGDLVATIMQEAVVSLR